MRTSAKPSSLMSPIPATLVELPDRRDEPVQRVASRPIAAVGGQQAREFETRPEARPTVDDIALTGVGDSIRIGVARTDE